MTQATPTDEQKEIAELVRSGAYFTEARRWYQAIYIGPIAERTFFLMLACLAGIVGLIAVIAVLGLLPVTEHPAEVLATNRLDEVAMRLEQMDPQGVPLAQATREFFLKLYVSSRESYDPYHFTLNYNFVAAHSDAAAGTAFAAVNAPTVPTSPYVQLGQAGTRSVHIDSVDITDEKSDPQVATVRFSTTSELGESVTTSQWTATISFHYSAFDIQQFRDRQTGEIGSTVKEPTFQVVGYARTPS